MILHEGTPYLEFVIGFTAIISLLHVYLDTRQIKALKRPGPPAEVSHLYKDDDFKKSTSYQLDRLQVGMVQSAWDTGTNLAFLWLKFYPLTWKLSGDLLANSPFPSFTGEISQSVIWMLLITIISTVMGLPWSIYRTFWLEARHGFNKTTPKTFVMDTIKSLVLTFVLAPPIVAGAVWILLRTGPQMVVYLWGFLFTISMVGMTIYPTLIAPLFNKYDPLPEGPLKSKIEALAAGLKFPLRKLFVVDGSTRSTKANAYMYGFFKNKRIVLYDTLITKCTDDDEIVAVLAHELGHWKLGHTPRLFVASQIMLIAQLSLFALSRGAPGLFASFGFLPDQRPALAALILFQMIIGPVDEVLGLLQNVVSRVFEFQADGFAVKQGWGKPLRTALCTLDKENRGPPNVDALYSAYHFSHPALPERLRAIDAAMRKTE